MIKCDGFLKLLKLSCFGLLTSFFTLFVGSSASATYQVIGLDKYPSSFNSQYNLGFIKGGGLLTDFLGTTKGILALDTNTLFWWTPDGRPYWYSSDSQGFFDTVFSCPAIIESGVSYELDFSSCSGIPISGLDYITMFKGFFNKVVPGDLVWYDYGRNAGGVNCSFSNSKHIVCFSSQELNAALCFAVGGCYNGCQGGSSACLNYCKGTICAGGFYDSQNYNSLNFGNVPYSSIGVAPGQNGYGGQYNGSDGGSQGTDIINNITGSYVTANCTWNDIVIALESEGYNKYLCYGGLDDFDLYDSSLNYNPIPGSGRSIGEIWAHSTSRAWDDFPEFFTFWNGIYTDTTNNNYTAMWESYPAVYRTYFQLYNTYQNGAVDPRTLLEYCQIKAFSGLDLSNTVTMSYFKPACEKIIQEKQTGVWGSRLNGDLYSGGVYTGNVPISVNWDGVGNISGNSTYTDGTTFLQNFFNSARKVVPTNYSGDLFGGGFLPKYIILFLCAIILFRFLRH